MGGEEFNHVVEQSRELCGIGPVIYNFGIQSMLSNSRIGQITSLMGGETVE